MPLPWVISFVMVMVLVFMMKIVYGSLFMAMETKSGYYNNLCSKWSW